jgi:tRNA pseudouridine55 synthase
LGEATKTVPLIMDARKCYHFRVAFGVATSTDDAGGGVLARSDKRPTDAEVEAALAAFRGLIQQVPPQVSAVKVDGARAYDLAREGIEMDLAPRELLVERLVMTGRPDADHADFEMVCGKGGYVRSIARDLGQALGCLGHVAWLRREWSGPFAASGACSLEDIERLARTDEIDRLLQPMEMGLSGLPELRATPEGAVRSRNGNPGQVLGHIAYGDEAWASLNGQAIAVGRYMGGELHPSRVFVR